MPRERNAFKLGLTGIVMVGLFFAVLLFLAGRSWGRATQLVTVRFSHEVVLPVLKPGSAVFCGASQVGQVKRVWFSGNDPQGPPGPDEPLYVYVQASVDTTVGLRSDAHVVAQGPLLGGSGTLLIKNRGVSSVSADEQTLIEGREAGSFGVVVESMAAELDAKTPGSLLASIKTQLDPKDATSVMAMVHSSLRDINHITTRLSIELDPQERGVLLAQLHDILSDINTATTLLKEEMEPGREAALMSGVHEAIDRINEGLHEGVAMLKENREPLRRTMDELEATTRVVNREIVAQLAAELDPEREGTLLAGVHHALDQVNVSLDNLAVVSANTKELVLLNKHNINSAMTNLQVASDYLKGGIKYLVAHPWLLLNPPLDKDSQERRTAQAAREFTEAAARLDDAMAQLRAVLELEGAQASPDDPRLQEARQQLEDAKAGFGRAEAFLWKMMQ